jgi:hypothetical protein
VTNFREARRSQREQLSAWVKVRGKVRRGRRVYSYCCRDDDDH